MGIQLTGLASGLDTASIVSDLMEIEKTKVEALEKDKTLVEWEDEVWSDVNSKLYSFYKEELFEFKSVGSYNEKNITSSNNSVLKGTSAGSNVSGSYSIPVTQVAETAGIIGDELAGVTSSSTAATVLGLGDGETRTITLTDADGDDYDITIEDTDTMAGIAKKIEDLDIGIKASFDSDYGRFFIATEETGESAVINFSGDADALTGLGITTTSAVGVNAVFQYNGTELESESNDVTVNGLEFEIYDTGSSRITVTHDSEAIYDQVKSFITKYNELMSEFNELLDADYVLDDYEPLTDAEKEAMSEDEIKSWEELIKGSLLRNDDILYSLTRSMRTTLTINNGVDTSDFTYKSLSELGIVTGDYSEEGALHIYGDEEDSTYSAKDNLLMKAIEDDPDAVMELLTALGSKLYSTFGEKMQSSTLSSALTFYNDKYLDDQNDDYEDEIKEMEDRLEQIEERYYSQFTAMEQAIQQANSTSEWLSQQLASL